MIRIVIAGDFVPRDSVAEKIEEGNYSCLDAISPVIHNTDYAIVNFESPVVTRRANPIVKTGPNLRCTDKAMECIVQAGFKCVTLANNHFRDYGQIGVEDTLSTCKRLGVDYVGGGIDLEEANRILYKTIKGKSLAIINVCENEWSIATNYTGGGAPLNPILNYYAIQEAKKQADFVIVIVHGGIEHYQYPTPRMVQTYHFFIDAGADAVVNHHQHCMNGYEVYKEKPIFYGLGNFCFAKGAVSVKTEKWEKGYLVILKLSENIEYELLPYRQGCEGLTISDREVFEKEMIQLCQPLNNINQLVQKFDQYIVEKGREVKIQILPTFLSGKIGAALARRGFYGKIYSGKQLYAIKNRLCCESHLESLQRLFCQLTEKERN